MPMSPIARCFVGIFALVALCVGLALPPAVHAQDTLEVPPSVWAWFINRDGSCVQCSIGMCGVWQNTPAATTLLWDTPYGSRVRGGSWPGRVESYCDARRIPAYNVTGSNTWDWMKWASKTGRIAAIGCFGSHFQTLVYYDPRPDVAKPWRVQNNWGGTFDKPYAFTESEFRRHHLASGQWVVILKTPSPPALPTYREWWRDSP